MKQRQEKFYTKLSYRELANTKSLSPVNMAESQSVFEEYLLENDLNPDDTALGRGYVPKKRN